MNTRGIILSGGSGTRLYPSTIATSKQLLSVYDKPMIYYSLSVLMLSQIQEILIITTPEDIDSYKKLLGNGERFGISLSYQTQEQPNGIAEAFLIGEDFIGSNNVALILGDNIFYGQGLSESLISAKNYSDGATVFGYRVKDPENFGVLEFDKKNNVIGIEEKPKEPKSNYVITGLYFYDNNVVKYAKSLKPSDRGELEITDLNRCYLNNNNLKVKLLGRGFAWLDSGTSENLLNAGQFIQTVEERQGIKIGCLEEIAFQNQWLNIDNFKKNISQIKDCSYKEYLLNLI